MKIPLSWLKEYVEIDLPLEELAARVDVSIGVVEGLERIGVPDVDGNLGLYRVGRVLEAGRHPNADRLQLCRVDVGENEPRQIVCGAWNFGAGATVAVALPGAVLPGGTKLERAKLRGEVSDGMILSERELELGHDHSGILVLAGGEPERRSATCCLWGRRFSRWRSRTTGPTSFRSTASRATWPRSCASNSLRLRARIRSRSATSRSTSGSRTSRAARRYVGRLFRDVKVGPSPAWLGARLTAAGMRPISNVVDVTNYVMLGLGKSTPRLRLLHAGRGTRRRPAGAARARRSARSTASGASSSRPTS